MLTTNSFAGIGALVGDPARASMLVALMDGRALTATELAATAGVTPQTASSHLAQLVQAGLLAMERQGRHRYHRLASPTVAQMVEGVMSVAATATIVGRAPRTGPREQALRHARTCYDHLAGRVAVAMAETMVARGQIEFAADGGEVTEAGLTFLGNMGLDLSRPANANRSKRIFCRSCLDWSERRPHIAGLVGASLFTHLLERGWIRTTPGSRAVNVTVAGQRRLGELFELDSMLWRRSAV